MQSPKFSTLSETNLYFAFFFSVPRIPPINLRLHDEPTNDIPSNTNTTPSILTSYSTTLEWDPVPADEVRGIIRGYTITYQPVEVYYITRARRSVADLAHVVNTSSTSVELDDLLFYTNYSAHVQAYTVDNGVPSSEFHFMTPEGGKVHAHFSFEIVILVYGIT